MTARQARSWISFAAFAAMAAAQQAPQPEMSPRPRTLTAQERAILQSPEFQRRLAESYLGDLEIEPKLNPAEREAMVAVMQLVSGDKLDEALVALKEQAKPEASAVFDFTLANIHYQRDEADAAAQAYEIAVAKHPKFRRAWGNLGQLRYRGGDFLAARRAFARVIELGGGDAVLHGLLGVCHARLGDDIAAETAFRMANLLAPDTLDWKMGLAESLFRQRRFADAAALFRSMADAYPERAELWKFEGEAMAMLGETMRAVECFEMVSRLGAATPAVMNNLGDLYSSRQLFDLAVGSYLGALDASDKQKPERALRAARFMAATGALDEAAALADGVVSRRQELPVADQKAILNLRATIAVARGQGEEEAAVLARLVELDPLDGNSLVLLGRFHERSGDLEKAVFQFERAAAVPEFEAQAKLSHGQLLVRQSKYQQALPLIRRAVELQPKEAWQKYLEQVEAAARQR